MYLLASSTEAAEPTIAVDKPRAFINLADLNEHLADGEGEAITILYQGELRMSTSGGAEGGPIPHAKQRTVHAARAVLGNSFYASEQLVSDDVDAIRTVYIVSADGSVIEYHVFGSPDELINVNRPDVNFEKSPSQVSWVAGGEVAEIAVRSHVLAYSQALSPLTLATLAPPFPSRSLTLSEAMDENGRGGDFEAVDVVLDSQGYPTQFSVIWRDDAAEPRTPSRIEQSVVFGPLTDTSVGPLPAFIKSTWRSEFRSEGYDSGVANVVHVWQSDIRLTGVFQSDLSSVVASLHGRIIDETVVLQRGNPVLGESAPMAERVWRDGAIHLVYDEDLEKEIDLLKDGEASVSSSYHLLSLIVIVVLGAAAGLVIYHRRPA